jgi:hypothetical protein
VFHLGTVARQGRGGIKRGTPRSDAPGVGLLRSRALVS